MTDRDLHMRSTDAMDYLRHLDAAKKAMLEAIDQIKGCRDAYHGRPGLGSDAKFFDFDTAVHSLTDLISSLPKQPTTMVVSDGGCSGPDATEDRAA